MHSEVLRVRTSAYKWEKAIHPIMQVKASFTLGLAWEKG
jgi:hypothetical protein